MIPETQIPTKAFVVEAPNAPFVLQDVILDEVRDNEVLVEMKYTGLCHTDIVVQQGAMPVGDYPAVLGHEGAGIVRRVGRAVKDKTLKDGDQVFLSFTTCDSCNPCRDGRKGFCSDFTNINFAGVRGISATESPISTTAGKPVRGQFFGQSSMSKLAIVNEASVVKSNYNFSDSDFAALSPLGCGYLTGAGTVLNVLKPKPNSRFVVLGMGAVGLAAMMAARALGVETVVAVDIVDSKLELATSLGATHTLNTKRVTNLAEGLKELFPEGVDNILDTTGVVPLLQASIAALGHEGTLVFVGVAPATGTLTINPLEIMLSCKRIIGAIEGCSDPAKLLPQLLEWYKQGKFPVDKLAEVYSVDSLDQALEDLKAGKIIKPILKWGDI
ncbi:Polyketide synthase enoylreductase [Penicillium maclennaniae]|uniref:Polyketide synthase enoylreductase n=1 Tax=Penicillium maclennaniae TaxID=1343394 RepID=UPI00253FB511|nr:Polyketide synthase enoylreductase [Penicillium maclennaniae]KAJ5662360.1 Polyketide synthase enoylreductase [Penicillium maclennaniae]